MGEEDRLWVELEVDLVRGNWIYRGEVARAQLNEWQQGKREGSIALHNAYWFSTKPDGAIEWTIAGVSAGRASQYRGPFWIPMDSILLAIELLGGHERASLLAQTQTPRGPEVHDN